MFDFGKRWRNLFSRTADLQQVSLDTVRSEQLLLANELAGLEADRARIEADRQGLVERWGEVRCDGDESGRRFVARQFEVLQTQSCQLEKRHSDASTRLRILQGVENLKVHEQWQRAAGRGSVFGRDVGQLHAAIVATMAREIRQREQLAEILDTMIHADRRQLQQRAASLDDAMEALDGLLAERVGDGQGDAERALKAELMAMDQASSTPVRDAQS